MQGARLAITAMSAADFYRRRFPAFLAPESSDFDFNEPCVYKDGDVKARAPFWLDEGFTAPEHGVLHILTRSAANRGNARKIRAHVWSGPLPPGAFFEYNADVVIATPGFTFLQLATELNLAELVAYGDEICGYFAFSEDKPLGYRTRKVPLITLEGLKQFLAGAEGMRGYRQAVKALPFIVEGMLSPAATVVEMLACLSYHRGGYCLPVPQVNYPISLNKRASLLMRRDEVTADMCWPNRNLCLHFVGFDTGLNGDESYDTASCDVAEFDNQTNQPEADRLRSAALGFSGYDVLDVELSQVHDLYEFEELMANAAQSLGKVVPNKKRGPIPARVLLRENLFSWVEHHGHLNS